MWAVVIVLALLVIVVPAAVAANRRRQRSKRAMTEREVVADNARNAMRSLRRDADKRQKMRERDEVPSDNSSNYTQGG